MDRPSTNMKEPTISFTVMATGSRLRVETNRRQPPDVAKAEEDDDVPAAAMTRR